MRASSHTYIMHGQMRNLARAAVVAAARSGVGVGAVAAAEAAAVGGGATTRALATRHVGTTTTTATMMAWNSTSSLSSSSAWGAAAGQSVGRHLKGSGWRSGGGGVVGSRFMSSGAAPKATVGQGPVGWMSLGMVCITGGGLLYYYEVERSRRMEAIKAGPSAGKASIGGPFTLQNANENGKKFSTTQLHGKFALLYFGFTMVRRGEVAVVRVLFIPRRVYPSYRARAHTSHHVVSPTTKINNPDTSRHIPFHIPFPIPF